MNQSSDRNWALAGIVIGAMMLFGPSLGKFNFDQGVTPAPIVEPAKPKFDSLTLIVLEEDARQRGTTAADVFNSAEFWDNLRARKVEWRWIERENIDRNPVYSQYFAANKQPLPAVMVLDPSNSMIENFALPATAAEIDAKIKERLK